MLCFDRQLDEQIVIGDDIVITVVRIKGRKVRIGIDAPREIRVDRQEVRDAIERDRKDGAA
jgi:carbon storage regulator